MTQVPAEAQRLHNEARAVGGTGDYPRTLELLDQAIALAPDWAHPVYDKAFTCLLMGNNKAALELYERTLGLAPSGFFTADTAVDTLRREATGELPSGTYQAFVSLDWMAPNEKVAALRGMLQHLPEYAPAWKSYAATIEDDTERLEALERGLALNPDRCTKGNLLLNKALALSSLGRNAEALQTAETVHADPNTDAGTRGMAGAVLTQLRMT